MPRVWRRGGGSRVAFPEDVTGWQFAAVSFAEHIANHPYWSPWSAPSWMIESAEADTRLRQADVGCKGAVVFHLSEGVTYLQLRSKRTLSAFSECIGDVGQQVA